MLIGDFETEQMYYNTIMLALGLVTRIANLDFTTWRVSNGEQETLTLPEQFLFQQNFIVELFTNSTAGNA